MHRARSLNASPSVLRTSPSVLESVLESVRLEEFPATAILFCGSLLTLVFGVLNLIVAAAR